MFQPGDDRIGDGAQQTHHHVIMVASAADLVASTAPRGPQRNNSIQGFHKIADDMRKRRIFRKLETTVKPSPVLTEAVRRFPFPSRRAFRAE